MSASTRPTPASCRRACRRAQRSIDCATPSAKASSRRSSSRSGRTARLPPGQPAAPVRLLAADRRGSADHPRRQPRRRRPAADAAQYQLLYADPNGPRDRTSRPSSRATTKADLTAFTILTPYGPNATRRRALVRDLRRPGRRLAPPAGHDGPRRRRRRGRRRRRDRVAADFPRTALFILVTTYLVLFVLLRSVLLPVKALRDEHAVDRGAASARWSGSSRTATCRRCSGSSRSGSSRRPSR